MSFARTKSGFVAIIGRPNVGKSTLLNRILNKKVVITSKKAQTTRNRIAGIYNKKGVQIVFFDTPGIIYHPKNNFDRYMKKTSINILKDVDLIFFVTDSVNNIGEKKDKFIIERLKGIKRTPLFLIINKIDLLKNKEKLLRIINDYRKYIKWEEVFPISAFYGDQVNKLISNVTSKLKIGPRYFPKDQISDKPEYFFVSELIRKNILKFTNQEVPHAIAVIVNSMKFDKLTGKINIQVTIVVEKPSQKKIIIGKNGKMIKKIGESSRKDIENFLNKKVYLESWVRVKNNWRSNPQIFSEFGYDLKKGL